MINFIKRMVDKFCMKFRLIKNNNCSFALLNSKGFGLSVYDIIKDEQGNITSFNATFDKNCYKRYYTFHAVYTIRQDFYTKTGIFLDIVIEPKEVSNE